MSASSPSLSASEAPPLPKGRRRAVRRTRPLVAANESAASPAAPPQRSWGTALLDWLTRDRMLVWVFRSLAVVAVTVLVLDWRELSGLDRSLPDPPAAIPGAEPGTVPLPFRQPVRRPASDSPPPNEIVTDPDILAAPMTIELQTGGTLRLQGTIDPGAGERLATELSARGEYVTLVTLDSPGGSVEDALIMSAALRERGLATRVESGALCASSCPIVLSGGAVREVSEGASVGVHQIFARETDRLNPRFDGMAEAQRTTARIGRHLREMGVDGALWLYAMETPKDRLYYLSPDEMIEFGLATVLLDVGSETGAQRERSGESTGRGTRTRLGSD